MSNLHPDEDCKNTTSFVETSEAAVTMLSPDAEFQQLDVLADATKRIIGSIKGEDIERDGLQGTPLRFARAFAYFTEGYSKTAEEVVGDAIFGADHEDMVIVRDIPIHSLCEHHLIPFFGKAHIGYIPNPEKGIIGLSKFNRITEVFARRLQVQERLTGQIMKAIDRILQPRGVGVILECRHMCMEMRGVESPSTTITKRVCGVFHEHRVSHEFIALALLGKTIPASNTVTTCQHQTERSGFSPSSAKRLHGKPLSSNADDYRLYQTCANDEFSKIVTVIRETVMGPLSHISTGLSVLDIGAGNGRLLKEFCSVEGLEGCVSQYVAFEQDEDLCKELQSTVTSLGFHVGNSAIHPSQFNQDTTIEQAGGRAHIVLLSHSLYSATSKTDLVDQALECVAPGGVLLIFHRWKMDGSLDKLSSHLTRRKIIHQLEVWDTDLYVAHLSPRDQSRMSKYTKGAVAAYNESSTVKRTVGYIGVEVHSCKLDGKLASDDAIGDTRMKISYAARTKQPAAIVVPSTVVGVQACLRAASLKSVGCGSVTVIGGGHSGHCLADNAIAISMKLWDYVEVQPNSMVVRVGGGATIGRITAECEKHGLVVPLGDRPGVGVGLILQGGLNHLMRQYGLAADNILTVTYVDPAGKLQCAQNDEELFRFRGAGSNFGVVLELRLRVWKQSLILAQDTEYVLRADDASEVATEYSDVATSLPDTVCLDGFIFWSGHNTMSFSTSYFETNETLKRISPVLKTSVERVIQGQLSPFKPSQLFDRELYMTDSFDIGRVLTSTMPVPKKLRSSKQCLLLPPLTEVHETILFHAVRAAPTKWCYVHVLHGGGEVSRVASSKTAFGCRKWAFAAVVTARWPDGDKDLQSAAVQWLELTTAKLLPQSAGVYGSDLGPDDDYLSLHAFGPNNLQLAELKRKHDPLRVIGRACPLFGAASSHNDPRVHNRGVVLIFCGRRCVGKDWLAHFTEETLGKLIGNKKVVSVARISDGTKREYAEQHPGVNVEKLFHDRKYKELHRKELTDFYQKKKRNDPSYDARCFVDLIQKSSSSILLLTGMRDGLEYARSLAGRTVVLVKVDSTDDARTSRGWEYSRTLDESTLECLPDSMQEDFWDLRFDNNLSISQSSVEHWVKQKLAPLVLKCSTRQIPDAPQPDVVYKDFIGGLLLQPFALTLCSSLIVDWLGDSCDAIVVPEALGFIFGAPVAESLCKPLVVVRKGGKLPGCVHNVHYRGSNMHNLSQNDPECSLNIIAGSIVPGQRIVIIDDCLASGSTLKALVHLVELQGGTVEKLVCIMEFPDLLGRVNDIEVFSLMQFSGK